ncbi:hypothetical protein T439DRAFT_322118 [Meredithblackwellia eburnea MCA 4105]
MADEWAPTPLLPSTRDGGHSSSVEDDEDSLYEVEQLLLGAQMDLIAHRNTQAVSKLHQAVVLGSSAACATLGNIFARGIRQSPSPQTSPITTTGGSSRSDPVQKDRRRRDSDSVAPSSNSIARDRENGLKAAKLFVKGIQFELLKDVRPPVGQQHLWTATSHAARSEFDSPDSSVSEDDEDGAEGKWICLERMLDLVVGLTDCYRYGILSPTSELNYTPSPSDSPLLGPSVAGGSSKARSLWNRGADVAEAVLRHASVDTNVLGQHQAPASPPLTPYANDSLIFFPFTPLTPSMLLSQEGFPDSAFSHAHHRSHSSGSLAQKTRLAIQLHVLYILALQKFPSDPTLAEGYWSAIVQVGDSLASCGGTVSKEALEIVQKARRRLDQIRSNEVDLSWKQAKHGRTKSGTGSVNSTAESVEGTEKGIRMGSKGDAILEMWEEKRMSLESNSTVQDHAEAGYVTGSVGAEEALSTSPVEFNASSFSSESTVRPSSSPAQAAFAVLRRPLFPWRSTSLPAPNASADISPTTCSDHQPSRALASLAALAAVSTDKLRASKFQFSTSSNLPSPPETPELSPPTVHRSRIGFTIGDEEEQQDDPAPIAYDDAPESPTKSFRRSVRSDSRLVLLRRPGSSASFQPPATALSHLLRRAQSTATLTTAPFDFAHGPRLKGKGSLNIDGRKSTTETTNTNWEQRFIAKSGSGRVATNPETWTAGFWSGVSSLKRRSSTVGDKVLTMWSERTKPTAVKSLQKILQDDDSTGMYWADMDEVLAEEGHESDEEELSSPSPIASSSKISGSEADSCPASPTPSVATTMSLPKSARPLLSQKRSFVDVTSKPQLQVFCTPPTPEKNGLVTGEEGKLEGRRSGNDDMDPVLRELERRSRVGVKTTCSMCGKRGRNYPKDNKTGEFWCSRECRIDSQEAREIAEMTIPPCP